MKCYCCFIEVMVVLMWWWWQTFANFVECSSYDPLNDSSRDWQRSGCKMSPPKPPGPESSWRHCHSLYYIRAPRPVSRAESVADFLGPHDEVASSIWKWQQQRKKCDEALMSVESRYSPGHPVRV